MTNSSPEDGAVGTAVRMTAFQHRELRSGEWTRLGGAAILGDAATEHTLSALAADAQAAARAQGYATGWAEGRRAAEEQAHAAELEAAEQRRVADDRREAEHQAAVQALLTAAASLEHSVTETCAGK